MAEKLAHENKNGGTLLLARYYRFGIGVDRDMKKSIALYKKLSDKSIADASWQLAEIYRLGDGVPKDQAMAQEWYKKYHDALELQKTQKDLLYP